MNGKRMKLLRMKFSAAGMASVLIFVGSLLILLAAFWIAFRTYGHGNADIVQVFVRNIQLFISPAIAKRNAAR